MPLHELRTPVTNKQAVPVPPTPVKAIIDEPAAPPIQTRAVVAPAPVPPPREIPPQYTPVVPYVAPRENPFRTPPPSSPSRVTQTAPPDQEEDEEPVMPPIFWNGQPTVPYQYAHRCFKEGNGLLFRLVDAKHHIWSFYNDSRHAVVIDAELGGASQFTPLDGVVIKRNPQTQLYEGTMTVPPMTTRRLLQGTVKGFSFGYTSSTE